MSKNAIEKQSATNALAYLDEVGMSDDYTPDRIILNPIKIDNVKKAGGRGKFYIELGDDASSDLGYEVTIIPLIAQRTRAMFVDGDDRPVCASINNEHTVRDPKHPDCNSCPHGVYGGSCKSKVRLILAYKKKDGSWAPSVLNLPPTSIKHWDRYVSGLRTGNPPVPYFACQVTLGLKRIDKNSYTWNEVIYKNSEILDVDTLKMVREHRDALQAEAKEVKGRDFAEPGDRPAAASQPAPEPDSDIPSSETLPF